MAASLPLFSVIFRSLAPFTVITASNLSDALAVRAVFAVTPISVKVGVVDSNFSLASYQPIKSKPLLGTAVKAAFWPAKTILSARSETPISVTETV
ncbi:hypothetical protein SDC9_203042 [bioreactor metagenome]|uniref:Uncharacterized protein n=1 Tax=bioreactor metagenome TaxID=1076179 RepID=A0A645IWT3_9ZZZZ